MPRSHVIYAVFKRNFWSYFSGVTGYLFIIAFVTLGAYVAFSERFFTNNIASLDLLNEMFPWLLLFIVPAITMNIWSEERKLGTDELLFTLPVSDLEVLLGKFKAVVAVYTVALAFSLSHAIFLASIGQPDWGQLIAVYFGYWLAGAALLSAGMLASALTNSTRWHTSSASSSPPSRSSSGLSPSRPPLPSRISGSSAGWSISSVGRCSGPAWAGIWFPSAVARFSSETCCTSSPLRPFSCF